MGPGWCHIIPFETANFTGFAGHTRQFTGARILTSPDGRARPDFSLGLATLAAVTEIARGAVWADDSLHTDLSVEPDAALAR